MAKDKRSPDEVRQSLSWAMHVSLTVKGMPGELRQAQTVMYDSGVEAATENYNQLAEARDKGTLSADWGLERFPQTMAELIQLAELSLKTPEEMIWMGAQANCKPGERVAIKTEAMQAFRAGFLLTFGDFFIKDAGGTLTDEPATAEPKKSGCASIFVLVAAGIGTAFLLSL